MRTLVVPGEELYDDEREEFVRLPSVSFEIQHSLASLSKWEQKWKKPFIDDRQKTTEETLSYVELMTLTPGIPSGVYQRLSQENIESVIEEIEEQATATWFNEQKNPNAPVSREKITNEVIYYWMVSLNVPFEAENWHLSRLLTLLKVINAKNKPQEKMSKRDLAARNRALNEARKKQFNTKG